MELSINFNNVLQVSDELSQHRDQLQSCNASIREIAKNISISGQIKHSITNTLNNILADIDKECNVLRNMEQALEQTVDIYRSSEHRIAEGYRTQKSGEIQPEVINKLIDAIKIKDTETIFQILSKDQQKISNEEKNLIVRLLDEWGENILADGSSEFCEDLLTTTLEGSAGIGGLINALTAVAKGPAGNQSFIILNPAVAGKTAYLTKISSFMSSTAGKIGVPIIGGIVDFGLMLGDGESLKDAGIKAGAHTVIGVAGGEASAAIGAAIGSVIPGAGTVVGGIVGFFAGVAITTFGNGLFDAVYDNRHEIAQSLGAVWNQTTEYIENTGQKIGSVVNEWIENSANRIGSWIDNIGNAWTSGWQFMGSVWG